MRDLSVKITAVFGVVLHLAVSCLKDGVSVRNDQLTLFVWFYRVERSKLKVNWLVKVVRRIFETKLKT